MTAAADDRSQQVLDLLVYAPLGLLASVADRLPEFAEAGRQRAVAARMVGRFALDAADDRVGARLADARRHLDEFVRIVSDSADRATRPPSASSTEAGDDSPTDR